MKHRIALVSLAALLVCSASALAVTKSHRTTTTVAFSKKVASGKLSSRFAGCLKARQVRVDGRYMGNDILGASDTTDAQGRWKTNALIFPDDITLVVSVAPRTIQKNGLRIVCKGVKKNRDFG